MKYAFMSFSCPDLTLEEMLSTARKYGYNGIEPRLGGKHGKQHSHGIEVEASADQRKEIKQMAAESGIDICCLATSGQYVDPDNVDMQVQLTLQWIDLAADVGAPVIRVFGGKLPEGRSREQSVELLVQSLRLIAPHAERRGVTVCVETHDSWCDPQHLVDVMEQVNHPAIGINWDLMHPIRVGLTMEQAFTLVRPWVKYVHFHDGDFADGKIEYKPIGTGKVDHKQAVRLLKSMGYEGYLSGEWINWESYETHLPRELSMMKMLEN